MTLPKFLPFMARKDVFVCFVTPTPAPPGKVQSVTVSHPWMIDDTVYFNPRNSTYYPGLSVGVRVVTTVHPVQGLPKDRTSCLHRTVVGLVLRGLGSRGVQNPIKEESILLH